MKPLVRVRGLSYSYADPTDCADRSGGSGAPGRRRTLEGVSFDLYPGERLAVLGANGSGKSTLLACLAGLLRPAGEAGPEAGGGGAEGPVVFYDGGDALWPDRAEDLERIRGLIAVVPQNPDDQIIGSVVKEDAAFGPENLGLSGAELEERTAWALRRCNLERLAGRSPRFLSGGEKQRLALAGALAMKTPLLALDEAVSMLDPRGREDFLSLLDELSGEGKTILHITHSLEEACRCRRALVLHRGRLVFDGPPAALLSPDRGSLPALEDWGFVLPGPAAFRRLCPVPALCAGETAAASARAVFSVEETAGAIIAALRGGAVFDGPPAAAAGDTAPDTAEDRAAAPDRAAGNAGAAGAAGPPDADGASAEGPAPAPLAAFVNVSHAYAGSGAGIHSVTFTLPHTGGGRIIALVGKSGAGKSTVLKHINALLLPTEGRVFVFGEDTSDRGSSLALLRRRAALSVQSPESAFFEQYLADDVAAGPANRGLSGRALVRRVREALEEAGLPFGEFADRKTRSLSGGEKRRAAIAASAALDSEILLLDEPLAALDGFHGEKILAFLRRLRDGGKTVIVSTHDMETAALADQVAVMTECAPVQPGSPASQEAPAPRGTLAAFGPPREIFGRLWDEGWGLALPWAAAVGRRLAEAGLLPPGAVPLNAGELAECVRAAGTRGANVKAEGPPEGAPRAEPPPWRAPPPSRRRRKKTGAEFFRPVSFAGAARRPGAPANPGGGLKLPLLGILAALSMAGPQPAAPLAALALVMVCAAVYFGGAGPARLLRGFAPLLPWLLLIGAIQFTFTRPRPPPLKAFGLFFRTSALASLVSLYAALTPLGEFLGTLKRILSVFRRFGLPARDLSLAAGIAFRFVPVLAEEAERIVAARLSRGGKTRRLGMILSLIAPLFLRALERAETLAKAMVLRGYRR